MWVRLTGRLISLKAESWLQGQIGETSIIGDSYFETLSSKSGIGLRTNPPGGGLIEDFSVVDSEVFDSARINPRIIDFYERTTDYELDVWAQWCGIFRPFGRLLAALFSRRLQQLNMPISPLETSRGITSEIIQLVDDTETIIATGWLRKLVATNSVIYAGIYSTCKPPKFPGRCMKVVFPLPNGNATVIMKPQARSDGSLTLVSSGAGPGEPGFYFVVQKDRDTAWVRYLHAMKESIHVFVDNSELRADHVLNLWGATFLRLHYRMRRKPSLSDEEIDDLVVRQANDDSVSEERIHVTRTRPTG